VTNSGKNVLVVEDDATLNRLIVDQLRRLGYEAVGVTSLAQADSAIAAQEPGAILLDLRLPDSTGTADIERLSKLCPVIILTAYGSVEQAVQNVQAGATDFLIKPVSPGRLELAVRRAIETASMRRKIEILETQVKGRPANRMIGKSPAFERVLEMIGIVAETDTTVLIQGESGVGKELIAESIHEGSPRRDHPLVTIDCTTLQESLLESELFGHERGAFTSADRKKEGLIETAAGGTLFLDEIGEISPAIQAKLLRVLETGRFRRVGGTRDLMANVRFVAATNRNLASWAKDGKFREDLFYRLTAFVVDVPPLRERREDILAIANHFVETRSFLRNVPKRFGRAAEKALLDYAWPGNIRELRNVVERGLLMSATARDILPEHLSLPRAGNPADSAFTLRFDHEPTLDEVRNAYLRKILAEHDVPKAKLAEITGISERSIYRVLSDLD
jgi:two-component system NtrC family response regulator